MVHEKLGDSIRIGDEVQVKHELIAAPYVVIIKDFTFDGFYVGFDGHNVFVETNKIIVNHSADERDFLFHRNIYELCNTISEI